LERNVFMRGIVALFIFCSMFYPWTAFAQEDTQREYLFKLGKEAISYYEQNQLEAALFKFNQILLANPSDREALRLREMVGNEMLLQMLSKGGEISRVARALLLYAERAPIRRETDPKQIRRYVELAASGSAYQRYDAIALLEAQVGELAVPVLLPYLSNRARDDERVNIVLAVRRLGPSVVIPLIEALQTNDYFLKQQIAILLGHIGSRLALPDLKRILEDPRELPDIKTYAQNSIQQITGKPAIALPSAKVLYYQKALGYYNDDPAFKPISALHWLHWKWQDNQLMFQEVPLFAYNEIMAEHACYKALEIDANYQKAWALLVRIYYAQYTEITGVEEAVKEKGIQLPKEDVQKFLQEQPFAQKAKSIAAAGGPEILYLALKESLSPHEKRPEVSIKILEDLGEECKDRGDLAPILVVALLNKDKRIRYAAAEAIAKIGPIAQFSDAPKVIQALQEAIGEWDARTVLIIEDDDASRNKLVDLMRSKELNLEPFSAATGVEGLRRARTFPPEDMIILSSDLKDISSIDVLNSLRVEFQTRDTTILILCPENQKDKVQKLYQSVPQVKGFLTKPLNEVAVKSQVKKAMESVRSDYKKKANEVARRGVEALAGIQPTTALFKHLPAASESLANVLLTRHDSIRLPAIVALGNLGDKKAIPMLQELLLDKETALSLRLKAAWALGRIYIRNQIKLTTEDAQKMTSILQEKPTKEMEANLEYKQNLQKLQNQIYYLLGQANLGPEVRRDLFNSQRTQRATQTLDTKGIEAKPKEPTPTAKPGTEPTTPTEELGTEPTTPTEELGTEPTTPTEELGTEPTTPTEEPGTEPTTPTEEPGTTEGSGETWKDDTWPEDKTSSEKPAAPTSEPETPTDGAWGEE